MMSGRQHYKKRIMQRAEQSVVESAQADSNMAYPEAELRALTLSEVSSADEAMEVDGPPSKIIKLEPAESNDPYVFGEDAFEWKNVLVKTEKFDYEDPMFKNVFGCSFEPDANCCNVPRITLDFKNFYYMFEKWDAKLYSDYIDIIFRNKSKHYYTNQYNGKLRLRCYFVEISSFLLNGITGNENTALAICVYLLSVCCACGFYEFFGVKRYNQAVLTYEQFEKEFKLLEKSEIPSIMLDFYHFVSMSRYETNQPIMCFQYFFKSMGNMSMATYFIDFYNYLWVNSAYILKEL